jgi:hypothetical protein
MKQFLILAIVLSCLPMQCPAQTKAGWRAATPAELESFLPARASVDKERIETEMRTASGIVNDHGQLIASVVLITAGYAAEGKYSHYLLIQHAITLGDNMALPPGAYVIGWTRTDNGLLVHVFDAASVKERGVILARPLPQPKRVESFRIWPPDEQHYIQIGRYMLPYSIGN